MSEHVKWRELSARERDWLVHTAIFEPGGCPHDNVTVIQGTLKECDACGQQFGDTTYAMARSWPAYTTDIRAAWSVVDHMESRWWYCAVETYPSPYDINDGNEALATFKPTGMPGQPSTYVMATAPDVTEAICIAALRAVGVEVDA